MADFQSLRKEYTIRGLNENEVAPDPISQFLVWFDEACSAGLREPNAMTLATVDAQGHPSARIMLLKGFDQRGFVWFTNYESRKGHELAQNPYAALVFFWVDLERQVRIEGLVRPVAVDESDAYFQSRPRGSQIGAWVSPQSTVIAGRSAIEERLAAVEARYATQEPERPPYWGGYRLTPRSVEFWQGRPNRLHDRLRYRRGSDNWIIERLAP